MNRNDQQRGSVLILAVVVLVIIALLGMAFLQQTRMDRYATERYGRNYMDIVINGILAEIGNQLKIDIEKNQGLHLYDYPWTDPTQTGEIQAYDYDGNPVGNARGAVHDDHYLASTAPIVTGTGITDYVWPHLTNLTGVWLDLPEIGSSNNIPLTTVIEFNSRYASDAWASGRESGTAQPHDLVYQLTGYQVRGADADGDGILDSRWQWAPISVRDIGGRKFVMALRMIDLNSLININAATPLMTGDASSPAGDGGATLPLAQGYSPTDLDLSRLLTRMFNNNADFHYNSPGDFDDEMTALLDYRTLLGNLTTAAVPTTATQRYDALTALGGGTPAPSWGLWPLQTAIYGNNDRNFLSGDEMELRFRGGLNNPQTLTPLEVTLPRATRNWDGTGPNGAASEGQWSNVTPGSGTASLGAWFYGITDSGQLHDQPIAERRFPGVRHLLTTMSGTATYSPYTGSNKLRFDLKHQVAGLDRAPGVGNYDETVNRIRDQIEEAFKNPFGDPTVWYRGISAVADMDALIDQYLIGIVDYIDEDSVPTRRDIAGVQHFGIEKLPFIREVYVQALYADKDQLDATGAPAPDGVYDTWEYDPNDAPGLGNPAGTPPFDTRAMAIELGNPFSTPIAGDSLLDDAAPGSRRPIIRMVILQDGAPVDTWEFGDNVVVAAGTPEDYVAALRIPARTDEPSGGSGDDTLVIYSPPAAAIPDGDGNHAGDPDNGTPDGTPGRFSTDLGINTVPDTRRLELAPGTLTFDPTLGPIEVQLQVLNWVDANDDGIIDAAEVDGTNPWITYDTFATGIDFDPGPILHQPHASSADFPSRDPLTASPQHGQYTAYRDSRNINFLLTGLNAAGIAGDQRDMGTFDPTGVVTARPAQDYRFAGNADDGAVTQFGLDTKGTAAIPDADLIGRGFAIDDGGTLRSSFQLQVPDRPMLSVAELAWVFMFGFNATEDFPTRLANSVPEDRYLDIDPDPTGVVAEAGMGTAGLPHAAILLDMFTTVGPQADGQDNNNSDGDNDQTTDADDAKELLVPGTINVNTATLPVLTLAASLGGETIDQTEGLMRTIVSYRDAPMRTRTSDFNTPGGQSVDWDGATPYADEQIRDAARIRGERRERPGIASLGELLFLNPDASINGTPSWVDMQYLGRDGDVDSGGTTPPDWDLYPARGTTSATWNEVADDPEEKLARFQQLTQNFTVRSDRFAVYGIVRGYQDRGFNRTPLEEAQFIAIIDRGAMEADLSGTPRVVAFYRLK